MNPESVFSPAEAASPANQTRRSLLSLLGAGALAGGLASLARPGLTEAKKKKGKKKKKKKGGGTGPCGGSFTGSATPAEEAELLQLINVFRGQNGLPVLSRQGQLDSAALAHSRDMSTRCFFEHTNPDGIDPFQRMTAAGYTGVPLAENIYKGSGNLGSAAQAFDAWKNSDGHRRNMLHPEAREIGIGTALDNAGFMQWTNVFGRQRTV